MNDQAQTPEAPDDNVRQFIDDLSKAPSGPSVIHGMVKQAEDNDGLMFAHTGDCQHWVFIAASAIARIQNAGRTQCGGRLYSLAEIQLKSPETDLEKAYALVGDLHRTKLAQITTSVPTGGPPPIPCDPPKKLQRDELGNWYCA